MNVAVDVIRAERSDDSVGLESRDDLRFGTGKAQRDTVGSGDLVQLGKLRRSL